MLSTFHENDIFLIKKYGNDYSTNDIIYFRFPKTDSGVPEQYCLQRLVGLPGDTIEIKDKRVYLNNFMINDTNSLRFNYFVKSSRNLDSVFIKRYKLYEGGEISKEFDYSFSLNKQDLDSLRADSIIKKTEIKLEQRGAFDETVFPASTRYNWNRDQFGKLYLPKKNDTLLIDTVNINLYGKLISFYEKNKLSVKGDSIYINDELTKKYIVKKDYYFTMGDNRDNANDSRTWGFIPADCIKGKMITVLKRNLE